MGTALVTGAGGFVGATLVRRLLRDREQVVAVVRPGADLWRLEEVAADVELLELDLRAASEVRRAVATVAPTAVFHLAAHGAYSWQREVDDIVAVNVGATAALLEACREADVEAFIHAGSSSEYGDKDHAPTEDEALDPASQYAVTKAAATHLCRHAARVDDLPTITLRLYSVYGPWEEPGRLVPALISRALRGKLPPLVSPGTVRDFVYVDDVAEAFVLAAARARRHAGAVFNVGSGTQTTLERMVDAVRDSLGVRAEPVWGTMPAREWDTAVWVSDPRAAQEALGWHARTSLEEGLLATAEWLRHHPELVARYAAA